MSREFFPLKSKYFSTDSQHKETEKELILDPSSHEFQQKILNSLEFPSNSPFLEVGEVQHNFF